MGLPGIFSSIDSFTKKAVRNHFDLYGRLPDWFPEVGEVAELVPSKDLHWSRFFREDPETRIRLHGTPEIGKIEVQYFSAGEFERLLKALGMSDF